MVSPFPQKRFKWIKYVKSYRANVYASQLIRRYTFFSRRLPHFRFVLHIFVCRLCFIKNKLKQVDAFHSFGDVTQNRIESYLSPCMHKAPANTTTTTTINNPHTTRKSKWVHCNCIARGAHEKCYGLIKRIMCNKYRDKNEFIVSLTIRHYDKFIIYWMNCSTKTTVSMWHVDFVNLPLRTVLSIHTIADGRVYHEWSIKLFNIYIGWTKRKLITPPEMNVNDHILSH